MTNREIIIKEVKENNLERINNGIKEFGITAQELFEKTSINRSLISHCLSVLNKEGKIIKINTRPVYFIDLEIFENSFDVELRGELIYKNFEELMEIKEKQKDPRIFLKNEENVFMDVIGYNGSLAYQIEQCKIAVKYPPKGLSVLIVGSTGSGKSFLAGKIYEYARANGYIKRDAPFLTFNCAKYSNNKELLSAALFGYKKGAFTGAETDREGIIENADGGYVFLDEIHRLPPEGQEQLFFFMDKGIFARIGENEVYRKADVRFIFATTEDPKAVLLNTFLRRIPIIIKKPPLRDRPLNEKFQLIYHFFKEESHLISHNIRISRHALKILMDADFEGNIGQLKNDITITCARAYNREDIMERGEREFIDIDFMMLPEYLVKNAINSKTNYIDSLYKGYITEDLIINKSDDINFLEKNFENEIHIQFYDSVLKLLSEIKMDNKDDFLIKKIQKLIDEYFKKLILNMNSYSSEDIRHERFYILYKCIQDMFSILKSKYDIRYTDNNIYKFACFIQTSMEHQYSLMLQDYESEINEYVDILKYSYPHEYDTTYKIINFIKINLDISLGKVEMVIIILYLINSGEENYSKKIKAVLIAHGYSTASSIANVANHLLGIDIFESFDMPIDTTTADIVEKLKQYFKEVNTSKGVIILVDMGSLEEIYKGLERVHHGDIGIINNLTTKLALKVGSDINQDLSIEQIINNVENLDGYKCKIIYTEQKRQKAIIVTCFTGIGTAIKIKDLLIKSLSEHPPNANFIVCNYLDLEKNKYNDDIFNKFDVLAIIGTENPGIKEVPFLYLEDLISDNEGYVFDRILKDIIPKQKVFQVKQSIMKYFTLEGVLSYITILNPDKIVNQLENAIEMLQYKLKKQFSNDTIICLYIHLSCLIERLVTKTQLEEEDIENIKAFREENKDFIDIVRSSFSYIESYYSVTIPLSEIYYLYQILSVKLDLKS